MIATAPQPVSLYQDMYAQFSAGLDPETYQRDVPHWREFLPATFPRYFGAAFGDHHAEFWDWVWAIERGVQPPPFVAVWPRGHGKSTAAEAAAIAVGVKGVRSYVLYVSSTQEQANTHVENIAAMLESSEIERDYPEMGNRKVGKYGNSRGWRRNRIRTASGLNIDAIGLDTAARGVKLDEYRPDFMVFDDIDLESDSAGGQSQGGKKEKLTATDKKIRRITRALLPAGSEDVAVLMIQNLVIADGIFARLVGTTTERADFLTNRIVSGPVPAIEDMEYEVTDGHATITGGTATWGGMDIAACQDEIDTIGIKAFRIECQHEVRERGAQIFQPEWWDGQNRYDPRMKYPTIARFVFWDTAEEDHEGAAYTVGVYGEMGPDYRIRIVDVVRVKVLFPQLLTTIESSAVKHNRDRRLRGLDIEYASSGRQAYQALRSQSPDWLKQIMRRVTPTKSKEVRADAAATWCQNGMVLLPMPDESVPWLYDFERELYDFPTGTYKDQVDAFSGLVNRRKQELTMGYRQRRQPATEQELAYVAD